MRAPSGSPWFFDRLQACVAQEDWGALCNLVGEDPVMASMRRHLDGLTRGEAHPDEDVEANKALVLRYFEMWSTGAGALADELLGSTYVDHSHPDVLGPAAARSLAPRWHTAHPSARMMVEIVAAEADLVAATNTIRTPSEVLARGLVFFRIAEGKLAEQWSCYPRGGEDRGA
jgi:predicted SnoaL-like aldol condensation-catalyzing enzyme